MQGLACPRCRGKLNKTAQGNLSCPACSVNYPQLGEVQCLWPEPGAALLDWRNRFNRRLSELDQETTTLAADPEQTPAQQHYLAGLKRYSHELRDLLTPLKVSEAIAPEVHLALNTQLPDHHGIDSYDQNIFRDWCWGEAENQQVVDYLLACLDDAGCREEIQTVAVLGAGAGRLARDLHLALGAQHTCVLDANPLLCLISQHMAQGEQLSLTEFPRVPIDQPVIEQTLPAQTACKDMTFICADALNPPLMPQSFDLLVTPWLIDVIDASLTAQVDVYASLVRTGGYWLNHGSLAFNRRRFNERLDESRVQQICEGGGFDVMHSENKELPYLASPHERQKRFELTYTQLCRRNDQPPVTPEQPFAHEPDWLADHKLKIPLSAEFQTQITTTRVHGFIMSLINGERSIKDMAAVLEEQRLMPKTEAAQAISHLLRVMHNESLAQQRAR